MTRPHHSPPEHPVKKTRRFTAEHAEIAEKTECFSLRSQRSLRLNRISSHALKVDTTDDLDEFIVGLSASRTPSRADPRCAGRRRWRDARTGRGILYGS